MSGDNKARITITIDPELLARIDALAEKLQDSRSELMERMIRQGIIDWEAKIKDMVNPLVRETLMRLMESPDMVRLVSGFVTGESMTRKEAEEKSKDIKRLRRRGRELEKEERERKSASASGESRSGGPAVNKQS